MQVFDLSYANSSERSSAAEVVGINWKRFVYSPCLKARRWFPQGRHKHHWEVQITLMKEFLSSSSAAEWIKSFYSLSLLQLDSHSTVKRSVFMWRLRFLWRPHFIALACINTEKTLEDITSFPESEKSSLGTFCWENLGLDKCFLPGNFGKCWKKGPNFCKWNNSAHARSRKEQQRGQKPSLKPWQNINETL